MMLNAPELSMRRNVQEAITSTIAHQRRRPKSTTDAAIPPVAAICRKTNGHGTMRIDDSMRMLRGPMTPNVRKTASASRRSEEGLIAFQTSNALGLRAMGVGEKVRRRGC